MTNLLHELRCFTGGELGNRAADEIERLRESSENQSVFAVVNGALISGKAFTIETVSAWLDTQGLCAVSKADAEQIERAKP